MAPNYRRNNAGFSGHGSRLSMATASSISNYELIRRGSVILKEKSAKQIKDLVSPTSLKVIYSNGNGNLPISFDQIKQKCYNCDAKTSNMGKDFNEMFIKSKNEFDNHNFFGPRHDPAQPGSRSGCEILNKTQHNIVKKATKILTLPIAESYAPSKRLTSLAAPQIDDTYAIIAKSNAIRREFLKEARELKERIERREARERRKQKLLIEREARKRDKKEQEKEQEKEIRKSVDKAIPLPIPKLSITRSIGFDDFSEIDD